jgi:hypothetical protein
MAAIAEQIVAAGANGCNTETSPTGWIVLGKWAESFPNARCATVNRLAIPPKIILRFVNREPRGSISVGATLLRLCLVVFKPASFAVSYYSHSMVAGGLFVMS